MPHPRQRRRTAIIIAFVFVFGITYCLFPGTVKKAHHGDSVTWPDDRRKKMTAAALSKDPAQNERIGTIHHPKRPKSSTKQNLYPIPPPRITIIAIWATTNEPRSYLPNFFASVAENPSIDLLFVKFDKYGVGCGLSLVPPSIEHTNIRQLCFRYQEYWDLHRDFLCDKRRWNCTLEERDTLGEALYKRGKIDWVNSHFRPFRSAVFRKWLNPGTPTWGWCDMDTMFGNFERNFPFDVSSQFDVLIPGQPAHDEQVLLFHPGHLTFFRHSERVIDEYMKYPRLKDLKTWLRIGEDKTLEEDQGWESHRLRDWISEGAEEVEYSTYTLTNPRLTFLRFPALSFTSHHLSSASLGVYGVTDGDRLDLITPAASAANRELIRNILEERKEATVPRHNPFQLFSPEGYEYVVKLHNATFSGWLWFPLRYSVHYEPDFKLADAMGFRRYVMRRAANGPVTERLEPAEPIFMRPPSGNLKNDPNANKEARSGQPILFEFLYNHFQVEKFQKWWILPDTALQPSDIMFIDRDRGMQIWNRGGTVTFRVRKEDVE
ncbi:uncharacterized protein EI90DRAFT_3153808 [Cantharellus anzutake]|uniref:uncharacterized protein n=1 Tax=Cantharellus anzutake TaxID=1750568 RepID=UPI0019059ABB|nr:uncharacterized protein EI90DRAFT_3153808 [Cantharellus anzutake]KAF8333036.1 hypothetical protein EI90DRAFT_3153808 [Cantharellus anzutake]